MRTFSTSSEQTPIQSKQTVKHIFESLEANNWHLVPEDPASVGHDKSLCSAESRHFFAFALHVFKQLDNLISLTSGKSNKIQDVIGNITIAKATRRNKYFCFIK